MFGKHPETRYRNPNPSLSISEASDQASFRWHVASRKLGTVGSIERCGSFHTLVLAAGGWTAVLQQPREEKYKPQGTDRKGNVLDRALEAYPITPW